MNEKIIAKIKELKEKNKNELGSSMVNGEKIALAYCFGYNTALAEVLELIREIEDGKD